MQNFVHLRDLSQWQEDISEHQKSKIDVIIFGYRELNPALPGYNALEVRAGDASRYTISELLYDFV